LRAFFDYPATAQLLVCRLSLPHRSLVEASGGRHYPVRRIHEAL
jgi:hypothetical protein